MKTKECLDENHSQCNNELCNCPHHSTGNLSKPEPPPAHNDYEPIMNLVMKDLQERYDFGLKKYGTPLQPFNGRNPLVDTYQEAVDKVIYLRQEIEERLLFSRAVHDYFAEVGINLPERSYVDLGQFKRDIKLAIDRVNQIRHEAELLRMKSSGEVWIWQHDAYDLPESLVCPILISHRHFLPMWRRWLEPDKPSEPIPMILHCPICHSQHIDEPESNEEYERRVAMHQGPLELWMNPPHKTHLCRNCGTKWRPAPVPTVGVASIDSRGENDTWPIQTPK